MTSSSSTSSDGYRLGRSYLSASRLASVISKRQDRMEATIHYVWPTWQPERRGLPNLYETSPEVNGLDIQLHGFDISNALFPNTSWLPKNIILSTSNLLEEPPKSLHGQFDAVHLRLVLTLIRSGSPKPIIQHVKMLLKPGGYLQWDEADPFNHYDVLIPISETDAPNMMAAFQNLKDLADWSWIAKLPQTLLEEGFHDAIQYSNEPRPEMFKSWTYLDLCTSEEISHHWYGEDDEHAKEWRGYIPKAYEEADASNGAVLRVRPTVTIARKPL
ncbi:hypothetical protein FHL15_000276 [Xylaria flabelliformis]|uniref:Methyltransferase type 11 domain-containing protein n=1 Tax=Xylaria flabelliformis TaxID=2512241 RepID=A0A553IFG9_9PEZI|nr:hypothetical protein FHL15_000276 [Xylaria flabelliformis]